MRAWNKRGAMGIAIALLLVICIDGFLFMGQMAITDISAEMGEGTGNAIAFFNYRNSFISKADKGNYTINTNSSSGELVGTEASINPETGNIFTDTFAKVKSFFVGIVSGMAFFFEILAGPYRYVVMLGTPAWFSYTVGAIWYLMTLLLFVLLIAGRNTD